jgi:hypothetical protein
MTLHSSVVLSPNLATFASECTDGLGHLRFSSRRSGSGESQPLKPRSVLLLCVAVSCRPLLSMSEVTVPVHTVTCCGTVHSCCLRLRDNMLDAASKRCTNHLAIMRRSQECLPNKVLCKDCTWAAGRYGQPDQTLIKGHPGPRAGVPLPLIHSGASAPLPLAASRRLWLWLRKGQMNGPGSALR